jgi:hypothetical protein
MRGETQLETNEENSKDEPVFLKKNRIHFLQININALVLTIKSEGGE